MLRKPQSPTSARAKLARIYAEALLNAAEKQSPARSADRAAPVAGRRAAPRPLRAGVLHQRVIGQGAPRGRPPGAFEGRAHPVLMNFLLVLNDHDG